MRSRARRDRSLPDGDGDGRRERRALEHRSAPQGDAQRARRGELRRRDCRELGAGPVRPRAPRPRGGARRYPRQRTRPGRAAGHHRGRGGGELRRAARLAGAIARGTRERREPARDATAGRRAACGGPRHRVRHLARPRPARVDPGARPGPGGSGRGHASTGSPC